MHAFRFDVKLNMLLVEMPDLLLVIRSFHLPFHHLPFHHSVQPCGQPLVPLFLVQPLQVETQISCLQDFSLPSQDLDYARMPHEGAVCSETKVTNQSTLGHRRPSQQTSNQKSPPMQNTGEESRGPSVGKFNTLLLDCRCRGTTEKG